MKMTDASPHGIFSADGDINLSTLLATSTVAVERRTGEGGAGAVAGWRHGTRTGGKNGKRSLDKKGN